MSERNPSAFPLSKAAYESYTDVGMTLRDYFAAKALPQIYAQSVKLSGDYDSMAKRAYHLADAMLEERAK